MWFSEESIRKALAQRKARAAAYAVASGWPDDLPAALVAVLNVLAAGGLPMARRQLADALGLASSTHVQKGLANLVSRGLVARVKLGRMGKGSPTRVGYFLSVKALKLLEDRVLCEANKQNAS